MAEEGLRQAAKEGDVSIVRKLLLSGTKQTENEVLKHIILSSFLSIVINPSLAFPLVLTILSSPSTLPKVPELPQKN